MIKLGVLISGSGTNLQAIIDAILRGSLDAQIELVISSKPDAQGLLRAERAGIPTIALTPEDYKDPVTADTRIVRALQNAAPDGSGVDYVVMAGYMRKVHEPLLTAFPNRIINLHPALLPAFKGAHAIEDAYTYGVKVTGVTVHFANDAYDAGPIIAQRSLVVEEGMSLEALEEQIHKIEHEIYPEVLQLLAEGRVHIETDGKVRIDSH